MSERELLLQELSKVKYELSVTIPQEMQNALDCGDLRENSEFSEIVSRQHVLSIRLQQLKERLGRLDNINLDTVSKTEVGVGSLVKVRDLTTNKIIQFKILMSEISEVEVDDYTEITMNSPIGKALLNKSVKDEVTVSYPNGIGKFRILSIKTLHDFK
jgi:transcription elongation factor GreA